MTEIPVNASQFDLPWVPQGESEVKDFKKEIKNKSELAFFDDQQWKEAVPGFDLKAKPQTTGTGAGSDAQSDPANPGAGASNGEAPVLGDEASNAGTKKPSATGQEAIPSATGGDESLGEIPGSGDETSDPGLGAPGFGDDTELPSGELPGSGGMPGSGSGLPGAGDEMPGAGGGMPGLDNPLFGGSDETGADGPGDLDATFGKTDSEGGDESASAGSGETDPAQLAKLKEQGVDPTLVAHLQRYANDVASGREPPIDLVEAIKGLGVTDAEAKIKELGITGAKNEDPALPAHMARYEAYKASGEQVPPDLIAAIKAAGGSIDEAGGAEGAEGASDAEGAGGAEGGEGADSAGDGEEGAESAEGGSRTAPGGASGKDAEGSGTDDLTNKSLMGPGAGSGTDGLSDPSDVEIAPAGPLTTEQSIEAIGILRSSFLDPANMNMDGMMKLNDMGIPMEFPMQPDPQTVARLLGAKSFESATETTVEAMFKKAGVAMPANLFKAPLDEEALDSLEEAAETAPGAEGDGGEE